MKLELGELYFAHNDLDKAGDILSSAKNNAPQSGTVLAVLSANQAKQSGAMWDFTWGIRKLNLLSDAVEGVNKAVELEPTNFLPRIYRINTLTGL
ncbi:hypothetical protein KKA14_00795 [bacterium]|nr:hypothetical protein [bacterium]